MARVKSNNENVKHDENIILTGINNDLLEQVIVGTIIVNDRALREVMESGVQGYDFYNNNHRVVFETIRTAYDSASLSEKDEFKMDFLILQDLLQKNGQFNRVGGQAYFAEVMGPVSEANYSSAYFYMYLQMLRDYSNRRKLHDFGRLIENVAFNPTHDVAKIMEDIEEHYSKVVKYFMRGADVAKTFPDLVDNTITKIDEERKMPEDSFLGFKSGYSDLDEIIGAFTPGSLNIIAARPSMGKTALALNIAYKGVASDTKAPILFFSLEMSAEQIIHRFLSMATKIQLMKINRAVVNDTEMSLIYSLSKSVKDLNLFLDNTPGIDVGKFASICRRQKQKFGSIGLIIVDYLQLMKGTKDYKGNRVAEVSEISQSLKSIAIELNCPVIALSQLSRETEKRNEKKPKLSDLRDSGSIEQDADVVMLLYREDYYELENLKKESAFDNVAELNVAKNRNGPVGACKLVFRKEFTSFEALN